MHNNIPSIVTLTDRHSYTYTLTRTGTHTRSHADARIHTINYAYKMKCVITAWVQPNMIARRIYKTIEMPIQMQSSSSMLGL